MTEKKKKSFSFPHVYIMFMLVMLIVVILSFIVPAGEYERTPDPANPAIMQINPDVFNYVEDAKPITPMDFFAAMHLGVYNASHIIIMLLLAVGSLYLLEESGAIGAGIQALLRVSAGKEILVISALLTVFAVLGTIGFGEGGIPFIPLCMSVVMGMGYDQMAGVATASAGLMVGFSAGVINFYTTGVSQQIVGLPLYSGIGFRAVALVVFIIVAILYVVNYAKKTRKDPSKSIMGQAYLDQLAAEKTASSMEEFEFTGRRKLALLLLGVIFFLQAFGAINWGWGLPQLSAVYIMFAIALVIILKLNPNKAAVDFGYGAARLLPAALAIGFAGGVMVLMEQAKIVDTAVYALSNFLVGQPLIITMLLIYLSVIFFNFFVVSGSGKALILMPIMSPLGSILNINQQIMVLLYQYGDGFTNYFWPTSGGLMGALGMCDMEYEKWAKFSWKLVVILQIVAFLLILVANAIDLGPM